MCEREHTIGQGAVSILSVAPQLERSEERGGGAREVGSKRRTIAAVVWRTLTFHENSTIERELERVLVSQRKWGCMCMRERKPFKQLPHVLPALRPRVVRGNTRVIHCLSSLLPLSLKLVQFGFSNSQLSFFLFSSRSLLEYSLSLRRAGFRLEKGVLPLSHFSFLSLSLSHFLFSFSLGQVTRHILVSESVRFVCHLQSRLFRVWEGVERTKKEIVKGKGEK